MQHIISYYLFPQSVIIQHLDLYCTALASNRSAPSTWLQPKKNLHVVQMAARVSLNLRNLPTRLRGNGRFLGPLRVDLQVSRRLASIPVVRAPQAVLKSSNIDSVSFIRPRQPLWQQLSVIRPYSSSSAGDEGDEAGEKKPTDEQESDGQSDGDDSLGLLAPIVKQYAIAPVSIPDRFPEVPVLPISRNPIFPRFVKMLEVSLHAEVLIQDLLCCTCMYISRDGPDTP